MQDKMLEIVNAISAQVWGPPMLIFLVGTGLYLTFLLKGVQFRALFHSLYLAFIKRKDEGAEGDISHFQALMTALAATVGTGNIAGVATAIASGGPGALFWMWMTGLVGMATKYSEAVLAVKYREIDADGRMRGGPMYYIANGLGWKWLGGVFAVFASLAAFGIGNMTQSNSVAAVLQSTFEIPTWITGLVMMVSTGLVIIGGIKSIGRVTSIIVPVMIVLYMLGGIIVILINIESLPGIIQLVFSQAFTPTAAAGGFAGALVRDAVRFGVARGVFSNESGLGSAGIAAAAAQTRDPVTQALVSMTQTFIDTLVVCSITGFVIIGSGIWTTGATGAALTAAAFSQGLSGEIGGYIVAVGLVLFAYSTVLGWSYYGEKSITYLLGDKAAIPYRIIFCLFVGLGAVAQLDLVWAISDVMNGLMAVPNLIGLVFLAGVVASETRRYFNAR
jgi:AGCS family alanine or glycine:cation symporter